MSWTSGPAVHFVPMAHDLTPDGNRPDTAHLTVSRVMAGTDLISALCMVAEDHGGEPWLREKLAEVTQEFIAGVTLTSVSFEGGAGGGQVNRSPQELMVALKGAIAQLNGEPLNEGHHNFSQRPVVV